ncbi:hypothetical protein MKW94_007459 [Papaver nudicaule]|nr:hypothetical protein [Papaver nudicaule]MCL7038465.1 hypothetical protein [Papaver nudicaule]
MLSGHELDGSSSEKLHILEQVSVTTSSKGITEMRGSKDDKDTAPKYTSNITVKEVDQFSNDVTFKSLPDDGKNLTTMKGVKRTLANQRREDYESIFKEDITSKRSRSAEKVIRGTESMVGDTIPVGSHKSLISLRQCEEKSSYSERTQINHLNMGKNPSQKVGFPIMKNEKENVMEAIGSESDVQCAGVIKVQRSCSSDSQDSSSDSEDSSDTRLYFHQALAMMRRNKLKESKWQFEADMLSSLEEDPELCLRAVCALYRQKFPIEKSLNVASHSNNRGFNEYDALRGTTLAEFLMNGDPKGDLKKSVKDLEMFDREALGHCKRLATNYSKQLFTIYQKKEDPFFLPS